METKTAFVAIVGCPNVGKSSLLNRMLGQKVAIVSAKPQTTRTRIMGVLTQDETQLVFTDTPGYHRPKNKLGEKMVKAVIDGIDGVDAALLVVEPEKDGEEALRPAEEELLKKIKREGIPCVLVINKIDTVAEKENLAVRIAELMQLHDFAAVVPTSAVKGEGVDEVIEELTRLAQESPHFFPDDALTDQPERVIAAEIIREKMLRLLDREVPHGIAVSIEQMHEREDGSGGEPQGHRHRQEGRHAQEDLHLRPRGHGEVLRLPHQPAVLGQGPRGLERPRRTHPQLRTRLN